MILTMFAAEIFDSYLDFYQHEWGRRICPLHDPLAVASAIRPGLIETQVGAVSVETASPNTYGLTMFTPADRVKDRPATTQVARQVNVRAFLDMFVERLSAPPRGVR